MTNPSVTIRHVRHAIHLLMSGAARDIEGQFASADDAKTLVAEAFDEAADELNCWELETVANRSENLIAELQAMLGNEDCPMIIRELLVQHDLLP